MYGVSKINIETDLMMISVQDVVFRGNSLSRYLDIFAVKPWIILQSTSG